MVWGPDSLYFKALFLAQFSLNENKSSSTRPPPHQLLPSSAGRYCTLRKYFLGNEERELGAGLRTSNGSSVVIFASLSGCRSDFTHSPPLHTYPRVSQVEDTKDSLRPHSQWRSSPAHCLMISPDVCPGVG